MRVEDTFSFDIVHPEVWDKLDDFDIGGHPSTPLSEHLHNMFVVEVLLSGRSRLRV